MSGRAAWGGIAGAANALQAYFAERRASDDKAKLYAQEQDIMQKREEALAQIRANLQDTNAANRSNRAMNRDEFKHSLTKGDVTGAFKDEETGSIYGRTKDGNVVPLNITSDDYQDYKKRIEAGKAASGDLSGDKTQAQIDRTNAQTTNLTSQTTARDNKPAPDKMGEEIRKSFQANFAKAHDDWAKQAAAATKAGQPAPPFDPAAASDSAKAALYPVYGGDAVNASVGGGANKPKPAPMARAPQPAAQPKGYPDGTKLKGPGGKLYVVQGGRPIPVGGDTAPVSDAPDAQ